MCVWVLIMLGGWKMVRLDRVDNKIIELLKEHTELNWNQLWIKSFSREGQKCFNERISRLKELNIIVVKTRPFNNGLGYLISLK